MAIDENHPSIQRLVEKAAKKRAREILENALATISDRVWLDNQVACDPDDAVACARKEVWNDGMQYAHESLLNSIRGWMEYELERK